MTKEYQRQTRPEGYISAVPLPSTEELQKFYAELYYQKPQSASYQESYEKIELDHRNLRCAVLLAALAEGGVRSGAFLDIGAGEGFLMNAAVQAGFDVAGVDFSSFAVEKFFPALKDRLITGDIYESLERLERDGRRFAACSAVNVLEHVIDPELFLSRIRKVMEPAGLLAITVPNDFSGLHDLLIKEQMIDREFWFVPPQHLHYFNAGNLVTFCAGRGYDVVDAFSGFPIDLYLLHHGSNYIADPRNGKAAHRARMLHDLLIAQAGMDRYLRYYRAMYQVGMGRDITVILRLAR